MKKSSGKKLDTVTVNKVINAMKPKDLATLLVALRGGQAGPIIVRAS